MRVKTVIAVPGPWASLDDAAAAVAEIDVGEDSIGSGLRMEWLPAPRELARSVLAGGAPGAFTEGEAAALVGARGCVFVIDDEGGALEAARSIMGFVAGLLVVGGLAAKVESSGRSHGPTRWCGFDAAAPDDQLRAFVTLVGSPAAGFGSSGMHNLGFPDASLPGTTSPTEVGALLTAFNRMQLIARADMSKGALWSAVTGGTQYRVSPGASRFAEGSLVHNPFGEWRLRPH